ncbi:MAG: twin-arginine translocase TatA/TatE family subunit [Acidobacteriota bacterium]|nr:twin-arginine translocase TatA/TatE family subunit [Acidobacteriota bacterium]
MFGTDILAPSHIILILVVALIVLGPKRLPEVGRSLGRGLRDFRSGLQGVQDEARGVFQDVLDDPSQSQEDATTAPLAEPLAPVAAEPLAPIAAQPLPASPSAPKPVAATATKVAPVEPDPTEYAD